MDSLVDAHWAYTTHMALQLTSDLEQRIEHLAARTHCNASELAEHSLAQFLDHREGLERAVAEGRAAALRGELVEHDQAMREMDDLLANG